MNEDQVDIYAWITSTLSNEGFTGWGYEGVACDNALKTSISGTPTGNYDKIFIQWYIDT